MGEWRIMINVRSIRTSVVVVGAGPVGMTLALDLASRGVDVTVIEQRTQDALPRQRCNHISARTLEIFRRLGVADEIRDTGLPADYPQDVAYVTALTGHELSRIRIPARADRFGSIGYADSGWPTAEPPHRCNQMYFEPILQHHMLASPHIRVFYGTEVIEVDQNEGRATALASILEKRRAGRGARRIPGGLRWWAIVGAGRDRRQIRRGQRHSRTRSISSGRGSHLRVGNKPGG